MSEIGILAIDLAKSSFQVSVRPDRYRLRRHGKRSSTLVIL